ncbi:DUF1033 family protein [Macrococcoides canis]|uniref:DUF1033 family protein n=1 Tax=Macrococcoides canis TaxID=1855823 RepID=UPI0020B88AC4|nr:DUF1033 family protein [Macrococcus canis]UTG99048.1 DUF1033 family protein [Macrococcus canis]WBF51795.1 DUF1033 family protein [Macrococcus canis]
MYEVVTIRAEYEGWWLFKDLWDFVTELSRFDTLKDAEQYYIEQLSKLRSTFENELTGKYNIHAFYNNCELIYCEDCDDDIQIFHSLIVFKDKQVVTMNL